MCRTATVRLGSPQVHCHGIGREIVHVGGGVGRSTEVELLIMRRDVERRLISTRAGMVLYLLLVLWKDVTEVDSASVVEGGTVDSSEMVVGHERRVPE